MDTPWRKKLILYTGALVIAALAVLTWDVFKLLKAPMLNSEQQPVIVKLDHLTSAQQFVRVLQQKKLIHSHKLFNLLIRLQGYSHHLKAGVYEVLPGESAQRFLNRVVKGDVLVIPFTIIEGSTFSQITSKLKNMPYLNPDLEDWKPQNGTYSSPEGLLLAETYQYQAGSQAAALLNRANKELLNYLNESWANRDANLPYRSAYELLITASILEKEAALDEEKKLISGVIVNRLTHNMRLQMDPTVIYALGDQYKGKLTHADMSVDSPYNTYKNRGLPPTPIAMVGKKAIEAAAHPLRSGYFYFVAKGDGSHEFSETYEEQKRAINRYQIKEN